MSVSRPNASVSRTYSSVSNLSRSERRSASLSPLGGALLSTKMAMCAPTCFAVAVTVVLLVQSRFEQTLKVPMPPRLGGARATRSEEHTSELQSRLHLVCRLLLEKKK